jgi:hypothetical protein
MLIVAFLLEIERRHKSYLDRPPPERTRRGRCKPDG